jgi:WD40 repeat protein
MKRAILVVGLLIGSVLTPNAEVWAQAPLTPASGGRPQLWAIIVGVGNPAASTVPAERNPEVARQAFNMLGWFSAQAGWERSHMLLLTDFGGNADPGTVQSPEPNITPSKKNLDWAFRQWLAPRAKPGDVIVFYFAGQARFLATGGRSEAPMYELVTTGALGENLSVRGWSLETELDRYAKQGKFQIVCWLGTALRTEPAAVRKGGVPIEQTALSRDWLRRLARWPGVTVWLASDRAPAKPAADAALPFTQALLAGLGKGENKRNLSACLRTLQQNAGLPGFQSIGGVPPHLSLSAGQLGHPAKAPRPEMVMQVGHAGQVTEIASTADGRLLITASQDSTIRVWSQAQHALLRVLDGHSVGVTALGLSRNGRWLVSGGGRGEVLIHDLARNFTRKPVGRQPHDERSRIVQVTELPDGARVITLDSQARAFIWELDAPTLNPKRWPKDVECRNVVSGGQGDTGVVAAWYGDDSVHVFGSHGTGDTVIAGAGNLSAITISLDGRLLALGRDDGSVVVREISGQRQIERKSVPGAVRQLAISASHGLIVGHDGGVVLIPVNRDFTFGKKVDLITGWAPEKLAISLDGGLLAACAKNTGALEVLSVAETPPLKTIFANPKAGALTLAFSSDARTLFTGTKLGSINTMPLDENTKDSPRTYAANRGKIKHIGASPGRGFLLMINDLNQAQLWDVSQRTCRRLFGTWNSGVFLTDQILVLAEHPKGEQPGRLVRIDRNTLVADSSIFSRGSGTFTIDPETSFHVVTSSPDGTLVAAAASTFQEPLVVVWEARTGRIVRWIDAATLKDAVASLSFSADGRQLLTAGGSLEARLWNLSPGEGRIQSPTVTFCDASSRDITAAEIRPGAQKQMVTGHNDGRLLLWSWADGNARQERPLQILAEQFFIGAVHAVRFTPEGRYLSAAGFGPMIWLAEMGADVRPIGNLATPPHHLEQVNDLAVWPGLNQPNKPGPSVPGEAAVELTGPTLISGSDDTTVKFWDLDKRSLQSTFRAASGASESAQSGDRTVVRELDWILYTADGHFDASDAGRELVRFRHEETAHAMEQFDNTKLYTFGLSDLLRSGRLLEPASLDPTPPVAIDPPSRPDSAQGEVELIVALSSNDLKDVRVYHNGIPIQSGLEEARRQLKDRFAVRVRLLPGTNRFYAMASRDGAFDSRSEDVEIAYDGPVAPGRLHVIALGIGNYEREKLSFAQRDAERLSNVLHAKGLSPGQERGKSYLLTDNQVNARNVAKAFTEIEREVKGRPQDTVVLFLAGHTGVFDNERFCLLLPQYPFPAESPLMVAARSANPPIAPGAKLTSSDYLPYSMLAGNLMRLDALYRLVIVDACQAETIFFDPQVTAIQKWMAVGSRKARTSYLMAARRGEPALEVEPLGHGLLTYTVLRGMREIPLHDEPKSVAELKLRPDADYNGDGTITTAELDAYVKEAMPPIASVFPTLFVSRQGPSDLASPTPRGAIGAGNQKMDQSLKLQSSTISFPLIQLGRSTAAIP